MNVKYNDGQHWDVDQGCPQLHGGKKAKEEEEGEESKKKKKKYE